MGGCLSAQLASFYCLHQEAMRFHVLSTLSRKGHAWMSRFRDNVFCFYAPAVISVDDLMTLCYNTYHINLKIERQGYVVDTLEYRVSLLDQLQPISWRLKPRQKAKAWGPDPGTNSVKTFLRSMVPQLVRKALRYGSGPMQKIVAIDEQLASLLERGYPPHLVQRFFESCCHRCGAPEFFLRFGLGIVKERSAT